MNNAIGLINKDLQRHKVIVTLPGECEKKSLYLIMITAKTSKCEDLENTYGNEVTATHLKIAKKIFGENETENVYGVLIDESLQMVFAFNRDFADYDNKGEKIVFKDIDDVLVDRIELKDDTYMLPASKFHFSGGGGGRIRYSLTEKKAT